MKLETKINNNVNLTIILNDCINSHLKPKKLKKKKDYHHRHHHSLRILGHRTSGLARAIAIRPLVR